MELGRVVKSNSHYDYIVELHDSKSREDAPKADDYGFGSFVKLEDPTGDRHWAVGVIYNSQIMNPSFLSNGPRLTSEPDLMFAPDLVSEVRTLLWVALIGTLIRDNGDCYGIHGIPRVVVPVNTAVCTMERDEVYQFHLNQRRQPQFCYYSHLLRSGGIFAGELMEQLLGELIDSQLFADNDLRALGILRKELSWKNTMSAIR